MILNEELLRISLLLLLILLATLFELLNCLPTPSLTGRSANQRKNEKPVDATEAVSIINYN